MRHLVDLFAVQVPLWELVLRGTVIYWSIFLTFRYIMRRDVGAVGIADILLLVLIADAAQNAMAGGYTTITEGLVLVGTLVLWNVLLDWLAFRYRWAARLAEPPPVLLIRNGRLLYRNLRRELVTVDDVMAKLRTFGVDDIAEVKKAFIESDGEFTVIRHRNVAPPKAASRKRGTGA